MSRRGFVVVVALAGVLASPMAAAGSAPALPAAAVPREPATDAEIFGLLTTIHAVLLETAQTGRRSTTDRRVQALADTVAGHARAGQRRAAALGRRAGLRAIHGDADAGLRFEARRGLAGLPGRGREFDRAWLDGQIEALMLAIGRLNNEMRPHAHVEALRDELTAVVEQAAGDLGQAQALRAALAERTS
jgi:hypothetical protein